MATMPFMRLDKDKQISYRSTPEIVARLDLAAAKLAMRERFDGGKLRTGHLVNAVALWLGELGEDELRAFAAPKLRELERYLAGGDRPASAVVGDETIRPLRTVELAPPKLEGPDPPVRPVDGPARRPRKR